MSTGTAKQEYVDLHMHTTASDGIHSPARLLELVRSKNLKAFAITDHDTIDGMLEVRKLISNTDPELISGVELSVAIDGDDMHLLAYLFDTTHESFVEGLDLSALDASKEGSR